MKNAAVRRLLILFLLVSLILGVFAVLSVVILPKTPNISPALSDTQTNRQPILVIDPGHGGEDGGAIGIDGTEEKTLNLQIASILADILRLSGYDVRMTRTDDRLLYDLYDDLTDYTHRKKTYDLRNRARFTTDVSADAFLSIHMNQFPQAKYRGLQVYYSPNAPQSEFLAATVQNYTKQYIQPENHREIKAATSSIYLLKYLEIPAVLIECGFLSNEEECALLQSSDYQRRMALTIACAVAESFPTDGSS